MRNLKVLRVRRFANIQNSMEEGDLSQKLRMDWNEKTTEAHKSVSA